MANLPNFSSIKSSFGNLCMPSKVYLVLSVLFLIFTAFNTFSYMTFFVKFIFILLWIIFIGLWSFMINWVCQKGYESISWLLVILTYVFFFLLLLFGIDMMKKGQQVVQGQPVVEVDEKTQSQHQEKGEQGEQPPNKQKVEEKIPAQIQPHYNNTDLYSKQNRQYVSV